MKTKVIRERDPEKYKRIIGVDSSTLGIAWTKMVVGPRGPEPLDWDLIRTDALKETKDKLYFGHCGMMDVISDHQPDHIFIEMPIFVKNPDTARKLSFVVGSLLVACERMGVETTLVEPATWKAYIGYHNITRKFTQEATGRLGKTEGKKLCDSLRKSQTQRILTHRWPDFDASDDNIADSCAIAAYGVNQLSTQLLFEKNKEIAFDLKDLASKGLYI